MRRELAVKRKDISCWESFAEMIVCATIAKAELEHITRQRIDEACGMVQASALGMHSANERIESAHSNSLQGCAESEG